MEGIPALFSDLALILITAGVTTVIFKWLKQPLVLGYIVAGFLIGPYFTYFPSMAVAVFVLPPPISSRFFLRVSLTTPSLCLRASV